jgi:hypothetical protein
MGFFDKVKHFAGGHGVKVAHTEIERQAPGQVVMPATDTVVKGKFVVTADKPCEVLSMKAEFCMELNHADGRVETVVLGEDHFPDQYTSRQDDMLKYPYNLEGGGTAEDFFIISMQSDIPTELGKRNVQASAAKFFIRTMVDVKGSPFDPEAKDSVQITN